MRRWLLAGLALPGLAAAETAPAPTAPPVPGAPSAQGDVSVTIYPNNIALVQDVRRLDLPAGRSTQAFPDVSAQIRPETVSLAAADATVAEQNFDYDLLSPISLMEKAVGETITLVRTNPGSGAETRERATVLAVNGGVVLAVDGHIEVLRDDGLPARVIFDRVPPGLRARPTLSVALDSRRGGPRPVTLSYLTAGLSWNADYVALFDQAAGRIDVQGWVTLKNETGTTFASARTLLVAGNPTQGEPATEGARGGLVRAGTQTSARERLGDFYLYPLAERTTIADKQTKQVSFLDVHGAPASSGYRFRNGWNEGSDGPKSADSVLRFTTEAGSGLGDALPAGTVRVYVKDARGQAQFVGENVIGHTPQGSALAVKTGDAFDVKAEAAVTERVRLGAEHWRTSYSYTLTNAKPQPVTVELTQGGVPWWFSDSRLTAESLKSERRDADTEVWQVPVAANGKTVVTATFETRF